MSKDKLTDAIGGIGDDLIVAAKKNRTGIIVFRRVAAAAACLAILAGVVYVGFPKDEPSSNPPVLQNTTAATTVSSTLSVTPTTIPSTYSTTNPSTDFSTIPTTQPPTTTTVRPPYANPTAPLIYPVSPGTSPVSPLFPNSQLIQMAQRVEVNEPSQGFVSIGDDGSSGSSGGSQAMLNTTGISVQAKALSILPDVYMRQNTECILIHMKTLKAYNTGGMVDEFYYMLPVEYKTDFMKYDVLVIKDMCQYSYDYHVFYNQAKKCYEVVTLPIFGSWHNYGIYHGFWAFTDGKFDVSLWESNATWADNFKTDLERYYNVYAPYRIVTADTTIEQLENSVSLRNNTEYKSYNSLTSEEAIKALQHIAPFKNGIYLTGLGQHNRLSPDVQSTHTRWINGYPTNEYVRFSGEYIKFSQASFTEEDILRLPDLASGLLAVENAYNAGLITPPHIIDWEQCSLKSLKIIGRYVKANGQVYGMITVQWRYNNSNVINSDGLMDDKYYIIQYGSDVVESIDRDSLLELVGTDSGVYAGEYDNLGKVYQYRDYPGPVY